ncbi:DUF4124 domain-containing protein [Psychrobacter urativorans]|uniref:DUF4124 domain-containing protein n=1 Tax=Psychrobacter urativorans TaxID=45610 RepID=UPI00191A9547|nr:DUF4124 domain-containing protein [Psychrobacter urativorans]
MTLFSISSRLAKRITAMHNNGVLLKIRILTGLLISAASLYAPLLNAAPIYKIIDEQTGRITFTDNAQKYEQQAGKQISQMGITTETTGPTNSSASNAVASNTQTAPAPLATQTPKAVQVNYQLTMTEPSEERAYRRPAQNIVVNVQLRPALQTGDTVSIYLDDNQVAQGLNASIATIDVLPGAHSVKAVVRNEKGLAIKEVERTVYVIQNTATLQNNKKIGQQLLAYQQLPWHQKVLLKLRQDNINNQLEQKQ